MKHSSRIAAFAAVGVLVIGCASTAFAQSTASDDGAVFTGFYPVEGAAVHAVSVNIDSTYLEQLVQPTVLAVDKPVAAGAATRTASTPAAAAGSDEAAEPAVPANQDEAADSSAAVADGVEYYSAIFCGLKTPQVFNSTEELLATLRSSSLLLDAGLNKRIPPVTHVAADGTRTDKIDIAAVFDEAFFEAHSLVAVPAEEPHTGVSVSVTGVSVSDAGIEVQTETCTTGGGFAAITKRLLLVAVDKCSSSTSVTRVDTQTERVIEPPTQGSTPGQSAAEAPGAIEAPDPVDEPPAVDDPATVEEPEPTTYADLRGVRAYDPESVLVYFEDSWSRDQAFAYAAEHNMNVIEDLGWESHTIYNGLIFEGHALHITNPMDANDYQMTPFEAADYFMSTCDEVVFAEPMYYSKEIEEYLCL